MPLEISEIGVHLAVRDPNEKQATASGSNGINEPAKIMPAQQEEIVNECVRRVLQSLRKLEER